MFTRPAGTSMLGMKSSTRGASLRVNRAIHAVSEKKSKLVKKGATVQQADSDRLIQILAMKEDSTQGLGRCNRRDKHNKREIEKEEEDEQRIVLKKKKKEVPMVEARCDTKSRSTHHGEVELSFLLVWKITLRMRPEAGCALVGWIVRRSCEVIAQSCNGKKMAEQG